MEKEKGGGQKMESEKSKKSSMDRLLLSIRLEKLDVDLFRSLWLWTPNRARGTFGGQLIAHCIEAAAQTVAPEFIIHSLHSSFLRPGNSKQPMYYYVQRLRSGASFATRLVTARQDGLDVFIANLSFQKKLSPMDISVEEKEGIMPHPNPTMERGGIQHEKAMPANIPGPNEAITERQAMEAVVEKENTNFSKKFQENLRRKLVEPITPIAIRYLHSATPEQPLKSNEPQYAWFRTQYQGNDAKTHQVLAAFTSDFFLALAGTIPHGFPNHNTSMLVSLDHSIYFHKPFRVDDWYLYEVKSTWAGHDRALCTGKMYTQDGRHVMTTLQETLVRMKPGYRSVCKL